MGGIARVVRFGLLGGLLVGWLTPPPLAAREASLGWPVVLEGGPPPHPGAHWGRLENGLRWVVLPNSRPPGAASLRLRVEVGSRHEREHERGIAHLLEHMAFRGSQNLPPGELAASFARLGAAMGPDTNARTGFDSTVYQLELPKAEPEALEHALVVLREIAANLTIPADLLEIERGVVLAEARQGDTPGRRAFAASLAFLLPESGLAERLPIGTPEIVASADRALVEGFYRRWYRPERMILAIAGEVDPADMRARIERLFADLESVGPVPEPPPATPLLARGLEIALRGEPGLPPGLAITFRRPPDDRPDGLETRWRALVEAVVLRALGERLARLAALPDPDLVGPRVGIEDWPDAARLVRLRAGLAAERSEAAIAVLAREVWRLRLHGVLPEEVAEALAVRRAALEAGVRTAADRLSRSRVEAVLAAAADGRAYLDEAGLLALHDQLAARIDAESASAVARDLFAGEPLIELSLPELPEPDRGAVRARLAEIWRAAEGTALEPWRLEPRPTLAYAPDREPAPVVAREHLADLDVHAVRFANGVRLDVKPTDFEADTVRLTVRFGRGRLGLPPEELPPAGSTNAPPAAAATSPAPPQPTAAR